MAEFPDNLKYNKSHEWVKLDGNIATIGISDHAQEELTDVVYLELPGVGDTFNAGDEMAIIESVKSTSDISCPISGKIVEINSSLEDNPEKINESPYEDGWLVKIEVKDPAELDNLMSAADYQAGL